MGRHARFGGGVGLASTMLVAPTILLLLALPAATTAATTTSYARSVHTIKALHGSVCTKVDRACAACVKTKASKKSVTTVCTACSKGDLVDSVLIDNRCYCPAGSGRAGSPLTTGKSSAAASSSSSSSSSVPAHANKNKSKSSKPRLPTCAPCAVDAFASTANLVTAALCQPCPGGSTTRGNSGSATCFVEPGFYFDAALQQSTPCPNGYTCQGGDIFAEGQEYVDVDECAVSESPCFNSGVCVNMSGSFTCDCTGTGYTGATCETEVDECAASESPCFNSGVCANTPGSFTCDCTGTGYTDTICQTDIDECAASESPCFNSGVCVNKPGSFVCDCQGTGYTGTICETDIDECAAAQSPCESTNESCINTQGSFKCVALTSGGVDVGYYTLEGEPTKIPDYSSLSPFLTTTVQSIDFPLTMGDFANSGLAESVGARFTGYVDVPVEGLWTFYVKSDDGSKLWIDDAELIDHDGLHMMTEKSGQVPLTAGLHKLQVDYFEFDEAAGLILSWSGPETSKQVIPSANLWGLA